MYDNKHSNSNKKYSIKPNTASLLIKEFLSEKKRRLEGKVMAFQLLINIVFKKNHSL
jgi:hypothetical protein